MAANSWTREENEQFKNALELFSAFLPTRFENMAEYLQKPVADIKEHYEELVDGLLEIGSSQVAFPDELTEAMAQSLYQVERTVWNKEEHEWFLIGLKRFEKDWDKIAVLLITKNPIQIAIYAHNYFHWQNSMKNVMIRPRANDITLMETNVNSRDQQESLAHPQEPIVLEIGQNAKGPDSKSSLP